MYKRQSMYVNDTIFCMSCLVLAFSSSAQWKEFGPYTSAIQIREAKATQKPRNTYVGEFIQPGHGVNYIFISFVLVRHSFTVAMVIPGILPCRKQP